MRAYSAAVASVYYRARWAKEYAGSVDATQVSGSSKRGEHPDSGPGRAPIASTGCIAAVVIAVLAVLVIAPALLWGLGIACGAR